MIDPRRYFRLSSDVPIEDVLGARQTLRSEDVQRSRGSVERQDLWSYGRPIRDGLHCAKLFGPIEDFTCSCGELRGADHEGSTCVKCGVEIVARAERATRFAHIEYLYGLVHPVLAPVIAELLGVSADDVLEVARARAYFDEHGRVVRDVMESFSVVPTEHEGATTALAIHSRLPESDAGRFSDALAAVGAGPRNLVLGIVPVVPPGDRPMRRGIGGGVAAGPVDTAYRKFIEHANRVKRLGELEVPVVVWLYERQQAQLAFERLLATMSSHSDELPTVELEASFITTRPEEPLFGWDNIERADPARPIACVLLPGGRPLVQGPCAIAWHRDDGSIATLATAGFQLLACNATGTHLLFATDSTVEYALYDLREQRWLDAAANGFPIGLLLEQTEISYLAPTGSTVARRADGVVDYPAFRATTSDGRFWWIEDKEGSGGIYDATTATRELEFGDDHMDELVPGLRLDGRRVESSDTWHITTGSGRALELGSDQRWRIFRNGFVRRGDAAWFGLDLRTNCVAFAPGGDVLLAIGTKEYVLVEVAGEEPTIKERHDLTRFTEALSWKAAGLPRALRDKLAWRYGTLEAARRAPDDELVALGLSANRRQQLKAGKPTRPKPVKGKPARAKAPKGSTAKRRGQKRSVATFKGAKRSTPKRSGTKRGGTKRKAPKRRTR